MNPLKQLLSHGQSIWLDYISRRLLRSGELQRLVEEDGVRGVTSNPTIFDKAIGGGTDYDESLRRALAQNPNCGPGEMYERLAIEDIQAAADVLRGVYDDSQGADGYVSLEVSPHLAHDTEGTIKEAQRLKAAVDRPNVMIKVPATREGIPAIETLIAAGVNVNITLMFSMAHYEAVARAYLQGLERCADPRSVASVASFFVSRVDTMVDRALESLGTEAAKALMGKIAVANSKLVYQRFLDIFHGEGFAALRQRGARVQRPLWASTGTKNPAYSDVLYVENLIGAETVNTLPLETLKAFRDHGRASGETVRDSLDEAAGALERLRALGIDLNAVAEQLQTDGVAAFAASFDSLMETLARKRKSLVVPVNRQALNLGKLHNRVRRRLEAWQAHAFGRRLWEKDATLWSDKPVPELADRLGWLDLPQAMEKEVAALQAFAESIKSQGMRHVALLGMGGSSLAPEVFQLTFGNRAGYPALVVVDSTHPRAVRSAERRIDPEKTLFLVSSKSGTTIETASLFYYFWDRLKGLKENPGENFVAITDAGTALENMARERKFRAVFNAPPDVGGRYSALTVFGLLPAALIGVDLAALLERARRMAGSCGAAAAAEQNPGLALGAALAESARAKRDKVTFVCSPSLAAFPCWIEQLIAESTGKERKGIVPVAGETPAKPGDYGADRLFVYLRLEGDDNEGLDRHIAALESHEHPTIRIELGDRADLGQEFFRWEVAVAAAGAALGINPFDQPDVQLAKDLAKRAMNEPADQSGKTQKVKPEVSVEALDALHRAVSAWIAKRKPGDYIAVQAYLDPTPEHDAALKGICALLRARSSSATTLGYGPRFLHSTGQLHKGGPNTVMALQLIDQPTDDLAVPETDYTFGALIQAQALGDFSALRQRRRRALRVQLGADTLAGLSRVAEAVKGT